MMPQQRDLAKAYFFLTVVLLKLSNTKFFFSPKVCLYGDEKCGGETKRFVQKDSAWKDWNPNLLSLFWNLAKILAIEEVKTNTSAPKEDIGYTLLTNVLEGSLCGTETQISCSKNWDVGKTVQMIVWHQPNTEVWRINLVMDHSAWKTTKHYIKSKLLLLTMYSSNQQKSDLSTELTTVTIYQSTFLVHRNC